MNNSVFLFGRLVRKPELHSTHSGKSVTSFTLAVDNHFRKDDNGNNTADFIDCTAWGVTAENICKYFDRGNRIIVSGRLTTRLVDYNDRETNAPIRYTKIEVVADSFEFIEYKNSNQQNGNQQGAPAPQGNGQRFNQQNAPVQQGYQNGGYPQYAPAPQNAPAPQGNYQQGYNQQYAPTPQNGGYQHNAPAPQNAPAPAPAPQNAPAPQGNYNQQYAPANTDDDYPF